MPRTAGWTATDGVGYQLGSEFGPRFLGLFLPGPADMVQWHKLRLDRRWIQFVFTNAWPRLSFPPCAGGKSGLTGRMVCGYSSSSERPSVPFLLFKDKAGLYGMEMRTSNPEAPYCVLCSQSRLLLRRMKGGSSFRGHSPYFVALGWWKHPPALSRKGLWAAAERNGICSRPQAVDVEGKSVCSPSIVSRRGGDSYGMLQLPRTPGCCPSQPELEIVQPE